MKTVCIFGDSITWGALDAGGGWADRLKDFVMEHYDGEVYNLGVSGDNTNDLLERIDVEISAREPGIIIVAIGINDSQFVISENKNRTSIEQFALNLEGIIEKSAKETQQIICVGLTRVDESKTSPIPWNTDKKYLNEDVQRYDSVIQKVAKEKGLFYVDVSNLLTEEDLEDGLHPNSQGHEKLFNIIKEQAIPLPKQ